MSRKRRSFTAEFQACVALNALSSDQTLAELASKYCVHAKLPMEEAGKGRCCGFLFWQAIKGCPCTEDQIKDIHAKIG